MEDGASTGGASSAFLGASGPSVKDQTAEAASLCELLVSQLCLSAASLSCVSVPLLCGPHRAALRVPPAKWLSARGAVLLRSWAPSPGPAAGQCTQEVGISRLLASHRCHSSAVWREHLHMGHRTGLCVVWAPASSGSFASAVPSPHRRTMPWPLDGWRCKPAIVLMEHSVKPGSFPGSFL